jgi:hypothetical protein
VPRPLFPIVSRRGKRNLRCGFSLGRRSTHQRPRSGQNPGGLGAHAQNPAAPGRQNLEVELVEAHTEFVSGSAQSFLHRLSGEFAVCVAKCSHVSVVSLYGSCACEC